MIHNSSTGQNATAEVATTSVEATTQQPVRAYEAPAVESVVTSDDLQREVLYAGVPTSQPAPV